ncbi:unnamed protein product [Caenorhabditis auriculariae]|uniref:Uncharacterized protein n=1 Tax=Caenorhabditis auriculariae TaxID=2777116 RepID=A0A8S1HRM9_9PELO|nr:unnamed protein product [Caenorhabditis auriculariae]
MLLNSSICIKQTRETKKRRREDVGNGGKKDEGRSCRVGKRRSLLEETADEDGGNWTRQKDSGTKALTEADDDLRRHQKCPSDCWSRPTICRIGKAERRLKVHAEDFNPRTGKEGSAGKRGGRCRCEERSTTSTPDKDATENEDEERDAGQCGGSSEANQQLIPTHSSASVARPTAKTHKHSPDIITAIQLFRPQQPIGHQIAAATDRNNLATGNVKSKLQKVQHQRPRVLLSEQASRTRGQACSQCNNATANGLAENGRSKTNSKCIGSIYAHENNK